LIRSWKRAFKSANGTCFSLGQFSEKFVVRHEALVLLARHLPLITVVVRMTTFTPAALRPVDDLGDVLFEGPFPGSLPVFFS